MSQSRLPYVPQAAGESSAPVDEYFDYCIPCSGGNNNNSNSNNNNIQGGDDMNDPYQQLQPQQQQQHEHQSIVPFVAPENDVNNRRDQQQQYQYAGGHQYSPPQHQPRRSGRYNNNGNGSPPPPSFNTQGGAPLSTSLTGLQFYSEMSPQKNSIQQHMNIASNEMSPPKNIMQRKASAGNNIVMLCGSVTNSPTNGGSSRSSRAENNNNHIHVKQRRGSYNNNNNNNNNNNISNNHNSNISSYRTNVPPPPPKVRSGVKTPPAKQKKRAVGLNSTTATISRSKSLELDNSLVAVGIDGTIQQQQQQPIPPLSLWPPPPPVRIQSRTRLNEQQQLTVYEQHDDEPPYNALVAVNKLSLPSAPTEQKDAYCYDTNSQSMIVAARSSSKSYSDCCYHEVNLFGNDETAAAADTATFSSRGKDYISATTSDTTDTATFSSRARDYTNTTTSDTTDTTTFSSRGRDYDYDGTTTKPIMPRYESPTHYNHGNTNARRHIQRQLHNGSRKVDTNKRVERSSSAVRSRTFSSDSGSFEAGDSKTTTTAAAAAAGKRTQHQHSSYNESAMTTRVNSVCNELYTYLDELDNHHTNTTTAKQKKRQGKTKRHNDGGDNNNELVLVQRSKSHGSSSSKNTTIRRSSAQQVVRSLRAGMTPPRGRSTARRPLSRSLEMDSSSYASSYYEHHPTAEVDDNKFGIDVGMMSVNNRRHQGNNVVVGDNMRKTFVHHHHHHSPQRRVGASKSPVFGRASTATPPSSRRGNRDRRSSLRKGNKRESSKSPVSSNSRLAGEADAAAKITNTAKTASSSYSYVRKSSLNYSTETNLNTSRLDVNVGNDYDGNTTLNNGKDSDNEPEIQQHEHQKHLVGATNNKKSASSFHSAASSSSEVTTKQQTTTRRRGRSLSRARQSIANVGVVLPCTPKLSKLSHKVRDIASSTRRRRHVQSVDRMEHLTLGLRRLSSRETTIFSGMGMGSSVTKSTASLSTDLSDCDSSILSVMRSFKNHTEGNSSVTGTGNSSVGNGKVDTNNSRDRNKRGNSLSRRSSNRRQRGSSLSRHAQVALNTLDATGASFDITNTTGSNANISNSNKNNKPSGGSKEETTPPTTSTTPGLLPKEVLEAQDSKASMVYDVPFDPLTGRCNYHPSVCMAVKEDNCNNNDQQQEGSRDNDGGGGTTDNIEGLVFGWKIVRTTCPKCMYNIDSS